MNESIRALFPVTERAVYLNHAAVSAPPLPTIQAIQSYLADVSENGSLNFRNWLAVKEHARTQIATMLGARPEQVAFVRNTSDGLSTVANGYNWKPGDNLVTFRNEFPSNRYPWLRARDAYGVEIRICDERDGRVDLDQLIGLIDAKTRLVAISHVQYASGYRCDLERVARAARAHDALLVVDVIQSLGVVPIDVQAELVDVAAGACHKWLLTPEGVGFLFLSDRARERIEPTLVGWISVPDPENFDDFEQGWNEGTLAWETGTSPVGLIHGLDASLTLLTQTGIASIHNYLGELTDYLCERLRGSDYQVISSRVPAEKSQIVSIQHFAGVTPMELFHHLKEKRIMTAPRGHGLRISPHFYNTTADIDALVAALR
ncbi:MAG TPA: aminotransferase class V-fold PLP-dependent enzyme [Pyrinomonadaceae bacterium]|nr:aminotransferase class V-fold PLP-dependent enzyme [Pyrinomonadaceae bacterium]